MGRAKGTHSSAAAHRRSALPAHERDDRFAALLGPARGRSVDLEAAQAAAAFGDIPEEPLPVREDVSDAALQALHQHYPEVTRYANAVKERRKSFQDPELDAEREVQFAQAMSVLQALDFADPEDTGRKLRGAAEAMARMAEQERPLVARVDPAESDEAAHDQLNVEYGMSLYRAAAASMTVLAVEAEALAARKSATGGERTQLIAEGKQRLQDAETEADRLLVPLAAVRSRRRPLQVKLLVKAGVPIEDVVKVAKALDHSMESMTMRD